jgi:hypothetical protein
MNNRYVTNYCRHVGDGATPATGAVLTFDGDPPEVELSHWAFWHVPEGQRADRFKGKLIGESDNMRRERLSKGADN